MDKIKAEKCRLTEFVIVAKEILPSVLGADENFHRIDVINMFLTVFSFAGNGNFDTAVFAHGKKDIA
jgi:hypothetical protein